MAEWWPRAHNSWSYVPWNVFKFLPFLKTFVTDFSEPKKARKLKVCINMDNDWMYHVYQNKGQGSITLGVMSLGRFSTNKNAFCVVTFMFVSCFNETYTTLCF